MILTVSQVTSWKPHALGSAADAIDSIATALAEQLDDVVAAQSNLSETWRGSAADAATARITRERSLAVAISDAIASIAYELRNSASATESAREHVLSVVTDARTQGYAVDDSGTVDPSGLLGWLPLAPPETRDYARIQIERDAAELTLSVLAALRDAASVADEMQRRLRAAIEHLEVTGAAAESGAVVRSENGGFSWKPDVPATTAAASIGLVADATTEGLVSAARSSGDDVARIIGKGFGPFGAAIGVVPAIANDINGGMDPTKAVVTESGGVLAGVGSAALAGMALGSFVPGAGTAVGLVVGVAAGAVGGYLGSKFLQSIWD
ncbi:WXG100 family type VII secretion target [Rhodococcus sp. W8901]|uniref:WXG100 family type VII secretion target n=1 Tax=Rhodococcus sp. W8901 TaxID=2742603 RepID=UPI001581ADF0|nr:WXG100 family type VII secretion target [Rhodococcus sp. W8901]QKT10953.1 WXG100 family type VII secretion target [Rhodococcus sp. W8901]